MLGVIFVIFTSVPSSDMSQPLKATAARTQQLDNTMDHPNAIDTGFGAEAILHNTNLNRFMTAKAFLRALKTHLFSTARRR